MDQNRDQRETTPSPEIRVRGFASSGSSSGSSSDTSSDSHLQSSSGVSNPDDSVTVARPNKRSDASSVGPEKLKLTESSQEEKASSSKNAGSEVAEDSEVTVVSRKPPHSVGGNPTSTQQLGELLLGKQLGTFHLDSFLGSGGMGAVFQATDTQLHRQVAVKVLKNTDGDPDAIRRFRTEAQSAARLDHENIARVYHVGQDQGWNYIVLELVEGQTLRQLVADSGPLSFETALNFFQQLAAALQHAHHRQIIHRDIKPSNVLITPDQKVKLVDMGLARIVTSERQAEETEDGMTLGTFDYIAPEQARDPKSADEQSDLYSLGCTLFFALTGRPPFVGGNAIEKILNHNSAPRPNVGDFRTDLPQTANLLVTRLMAPNKEDRIKSADELGQALAYLQKPKSVGISKLDSQPVGFRIPILLSVAAATVFVLTSLMTDPAIESSIVFPEIPGTSDKINNLETKPQPAVTKVVPPENTGDTVSSIGPFKSEILRDDFPSTSDEEPESPFLLQISKQIQGNFNSEFEEGRGYLDRLLSKRLKSDLLDDSADGFLPSMNSGPSKVSEKEAVEKRSTRPDSDSILQTTTIQVRPQTVGANVPAMADRPNTLVVTNLADALGNLSKYSNVHTIELCFDSQLDCQPIVIDSPTLRVIKSGDGFRPKLRFTSDPQRTSPSLITIETGSIELAGIDWIIGGEAERESRLLDFPKLTQLIVSDCSFTLNSNRFIQSTSQWVDVNTSKLIPGNRQSQSSISFNDCVFRGGAQLVRVENFSPIQIKLVNVWLVTPSTVFEFGGVPEGAMESSAEIDIQRSSLISGAGLVNCAASSLRKHGQLLIRSKRSILAVEGEESLIRHDGQVQWKSNQMPLFFEGVQNRFCAETIWSISSNADFLNRSYSLQQAEGQAWFRQSEWMDWTGAALSESGQPISSMASQADWAFLPKTVSDRQAGIDSIGADSVSLPSFPAQSNR